MTNKELVVGNGAAFGRLRRGDGIRGFNAKYVWNRAALDTGLMQFNLYTFDDRLIWSGELV